MGFLCNQRVTVPLGEGLSAYRKWQHHGCIVAWKTREHKFERDNYNIILTAEKHKCCMMWDMEKYENVRIAEKVGKLHFYLAFFINLH